MLTGFPANSVFIVDSEDRVRHHTVLDPRFLVMMLIMYKFVDVDLLVGTGVDVDHPQGWMELGGGCEVGFRLQVCPVLSHGIRICIKRKKIHYGKFFDFCAEKCVYN